MPAFNLSVHQLSKHFGNRHIFENISFTHHQGTLGVSGPNGSGKSTLMKCLAGLMRPSDGSIEWSKEDQLLDSKSLKKIAGFAAPYVNLYPELGCEENLRFILELRGLKNSDWAIKNALAKTGIKPMAEQLFGKLSTGQQQRMRLAAAIIHGPEVLFLDEPGSNLDEKGRELIESLVAEFRMAAKPVIIASNSSDELALCDRVYSVEDERLI